MSTGWMSIGPLQIQASIGGIVEDGETGQAIAGVRVAITDGPVDFQRRVAAQALSYGARRASLPERLDHTFSRADGGFCFLDLPDGEYTLSFAFSGGARYYGSTTASVTVARDAPLGMQHVELPATGIKGQVQSATGTPIAFALIEVEGSTERARSDDEGHFYLTGVELGARKLKIGAQGYAPDAATVNVTAGEVTVADAKLTPLREPS